MKGIDVSSYQETIDWAAVKQTGLVDFAYAKATEGEYEIDPQYARNKAVCLERQIPFGSYHYFHPSEDPKAQAYHFLHVIGSGPNDTLIPMLDVEEADGLSSHEIVNAIHAFLSVVKGRPLIYTYYAFWNDTMKGNSEFAAYPLWLAEYNSDAEPTMPNGWSEWVLWQKSRTESVNGITGSVDFDVLNPRVAFKTLQK
ncbi:MAG: hypothetical protein KGL39_27260 [Patescibacteria group bacterium]|nr:hypothetical protein [Patescibacteria group bacterium]